MKRILGVVAVLLAVAAVAALWLTAPNSLDASALPEHTPDPVAGERVFWAASCASCHASPVDGARARGEQKLKLGGGLELDTPFGVFRVPNISPHPDDGIGRWSMLDFVNAMQAGTSPDGRHYYPSFPYASYARMPVEDVMDLKAFLDGLEPIAGRPADHELGFPWSVRRGIGAWKRLYLDPAPVIVVDENDPVLVRGRELVEGAGHCGECHTPRDDRGGPVNDRWLAGAPNLDGKGSIPNITPAGAGIAGWSAGDLAYYFESGFTPDFDTVGGSMVSVQENLAKLPAEDRAAIAAYLKAVPAIAPDESPGTSP